MKFNRVLYLPASKVNIEFLNFESDILPDKKGWDLVLNKTLKKQRWPQSELEKKISPDCSLQQKIFYLVAGLAQSDLERVTS